MKKFAIFGLGSFGSRLAGILADAGAEVIAVDRDPAVIEEIRDRVAMAICMDVTDEKALVAQGLDRVDVAIIGIGSDFESSLLTTVILKQLGVKSVIARAQTFNRGEILRRIGADDLVNPEAESAYRWAHRLLGPNVIEQIPLSDGVSLVRIPVPEAWQGKSLAELDVRRRHEVSVVAVGHGDSGVFEPPMPHDKLRPGDILVVIGADDTISTLPG